MISENIPGIWRTGNMIHRMCLRRYYLVQLITVSYETFNLFKHLKWDCFVTGNKGHCSIISLNHPLPQLIFTRVEATAERRQDWGFWIVLSFLFCQGLSAWRLWRVISADTRVLNSTHTFTSANHWIRCAIHRCISYFMNLFTSGETNNHLHSHLHLNGQFKVVVKKYVSIYFYDTIYEREKVISLHILYSILKTFALVGEF